MASRFARRSNGAAVLVSALVLAVGVFGVPVRYSSPVAIGLTLGQWLLMGGGALSLIAPAWRSGREEARRLALIGVLLILPWALLTLMPGYGPPYASNLPMNHVRYVILFVSAACLGAALMLLKDPLVAAGDALAAPLGQAAGVFATLIQLVWAALLIGWTMSEAQKPAVYLPLYGTPLGNASDVLLFFAGLLTYLASAFYALSLARLGWLGWRKVAMIVIVAGLAAVCLIIRGLEYPDLSDAWYMTPGMVVGIPAIPWLLPYLLGVSLLWRAADTRWASLHELRFRRSALPLEVDLMLDEVGHR